MVFNIFGGKRGDRDFDDVAGATSIKLTTLPDDIANELKAFDVDGNGNLSVGELRKAVVMWHDRSQQQRRVVMLLTSIVMLLLFGGMGLTAAVVELSKDVSVDPDGLVKSTGKQTRATLLSFLAFNEL